MIFTETKLKGAFLIAPQPGEDDRGYFMTTFDQQEFESYGINMRIAQIASSFNRRKGTLRGLHYQKAPHVQAKLVRCTHGSIYDVIVDLREDSPTFAKWFAVELNPSEKLTLFVPEGFAHGFMTLQDNTEVLYHLSCARHAESESGLRWNDPAYGIHWPSEPTTISERDRTFSEIAK